MEIKIFSNRPQKLNNKFPHSNDLFGNDDYGVTDFPYCYMISGSTSIFIVAIENNDVIGGIQLTHTENGWNMMGSDKNPKWCMMGMGVNEGHRGKGIATMLIEQQFKIMDELNITVVGQSGYSKIGIDTIIHMNVSSRNIHTLITLILNENFGGIFISYSIHTVMYVYTKY